MKVLLTFLAVLLTAVRLADGATPEAFQTRMEVRLRMAAVERLSVGGGKQVESMLREGLELLADKQKPDGSFGESYHPLNTGLAVLAIVGAGKPTTPKEKTMLSSAVAWLKKYGEIYNGHLAMVDFELGKELLAKEPDRQLTLYSGSSGGVINIVSGHPELSPDAQRWWRQCYDPISHAIVCAALTEYSAVEGDDAVKPLVEKATKIILDAQQVNGGWNEHFERAGPANLWTSAFQVRALKSVMAAGFNVEPVKKAIASAGKYGAGDYVPKGGPKWLIFKDKQSEIWDGLYLATANPASRSSLPQTAVKSSVDGWKGGDLNLYGEHLVGIGRLDQFMPAIWQQREGIFKDCYSSLVRNLVKNRYPKTFVDVHIGQGLTSKMIYGHPVAQLSILLRALETPYLFNQQ